MQTPTTIYKKICLLGEVAVGKTSLVRRFVEGCFDDRYLSTIGVKVTRRLVELLDARRITLLIWDLAGNEEFTEMQSSYIQGSSAALLVCDVTRADSLVSLERYTRQLWSLQPGAPVFLAANKVDLLAQRQLTQADVAQVAARLGCAWIMTSALTGEGVEQAFLSLASQLVPHG